MVKRAPAAKVVPSGQGREGQQEEEWPPWRAVFSQAPYIRTLQRSSTASSPSLEAPVPTPASSRRPHRPRRVWASLIAGKENFISDVRAEDDPTRPPPPAHLVNGHRRRTCPPAPSGPPAQRRSTPRARPCSMSWRSCGRLPTCCTLRQPRGRGPSSRQRSPKRILKTGQVKPGPSRALRQMVTSGGLDRHQGPRNPAATSPGYYYGQPGGAWPYDEYPRQGLGPLPSGRSKGAWQEPPSADRFERSGNALGLRPHGRGHASALPPAPF